MTEGIIIAIITGVFSFFGSIITLIGIIITKEKKSPTEGSKQPILNEVKSNDQNQVPEKRAKLIRVLLIFIVLALISVAAILVISKMNVEPIPDITIKDYNEDETKNNSTCLNSDINISEGGLTVFVDDYVYYQNPQDGCKLYRMDKYFGNREIIRDDVRVYWINYYKGWLYFAGSDSGDKSQYLYRMNKEGGSLQKLTSFNVHEPKISDGYIYYDVIEDNFLLHRCKIDDSVYYYDSDKFEANDERFSTRKAAYVVITNSNVYYLAASEDFICYKISKSTRYEEVFINRPVMELALQDNTLYYSLRREGGIYSIDLDSGKQSNLSSLSVNTMNICNQYIYFSNEKDNGKLYRIDIEDTKKDAQKILDVTVANINILGNLISYRNEYDGCCYWWVSDAKNFTPILFNSSL